MKTYIENIILNQKLLILLITNNYIICYKYFVSYTSVLLTSQVEINVSDHTKWSGIFIIQLVLAFISTKVSKCLKNIFL